jgi:hypothetical protein
MSRISPLQSGLTLGILVGGAHLGWVVLVATGVANWTMRFVFRLHFIRPPFEIDGFDPSIAAFLIGLTALSGFALGWLFAAIWNGLATLRATTAFRQASR